MGQVISVNYEDVGGGNDIVFERQVEITTAKTYHTKNAYFTCGTSDSGTTYGIGELVDGVLTQRKNISNDYTMTYDAITEILSVKHNGTYASYKYMSIMYEDLG